MNNEKYKIPDQYIGGEMDVLAKVECNSIENSKLLYADVCNRLSDVNSWEAMSNTSLSSFTIIDSNGNVVKRQTKQGDFIRIDIPGPGTKIGHGFDWVCVEIVSNDVIEQGNLFSIQVRPSANPNSESVKIAHFLNSIATSTFQIRRVDKTVSAEEHGRNETPNLNTGNFLDNLRNGLVGTAALLGLSYPQWKSLVEGLVNQGRKHSS